MASLEPPSSELSYVDVDVSIREQVQQAITRSVGLASGDLIGLQALGYSCVFIITVNCTCRPLYQGRGGSTDRLLRVHV